MSDESPKIVTFDGFVPELPTEFLVDRVVRLAELMSEKRFYNYQVDFSKAIVRTLLEREGEEITVLVARQAGKSTGIGSTCAAIAALFPTLAKDPRFENDPRFNLTDEKGNYRGFRNGVWIGIYGPKMEQSQIMFGVVSGALATDTAEQVFEELGLGDPDTWNGTTIQLSNGSRIIADTASPNSSIEGKSHHLLIVDEAQDVNDEKMEKSLSPMLASTAGSFVKVGSANTRASNFYRSVKRNRADYARGGRQRHFEYNWVTAAEENSLYAKYIAKEKERVGEDSDFFRMSYGCQFLLERGMFMTERMLYDPEICLPDPKRNAFANRTVGKFKRPWSIVVGIDFAKSKDSTVVTALAVNWESPALEYYAETLETAVQYTAYDKHIVDWLEIRGDDYETQFHMIEEYLERFGTSLKKITLDETGLGAVMADRYRSVYSDLGVEVEGVVFSSKSKSEMYRLVHTEFHGRRLTYPGSPVARKTREWNRFTLQLGDLQKEYRGGMMVCEAPPGPDSHDDYPDSLCLAVWGAEHPPADLEVELVDKNFFARAQ